MLAIGFLVAATVFVAPPVFADAASDCKDAGYQTATSQNACVQGYNGATCTASLFSGDQLQACKDGAQLAQKAQGQTGGTNNNNNNKNPGTVTPDNKKQGASSGTCGGTKTEFITCDGEGVAAIGSLIKYVIIGLTVLIGIVSVGGITYAAILYASAQDNSGQTQQAIGIIRNIVIGLLLYGFSVAIVNWLIPGGVIG